MAEIRGLGDALKLATETMRLPCGKIVQVATKALGMTGDCEDRQQALNRRFPVVRAPRFEYKGQPLPKRPRQPIGERT